MTSIRTTCPRCGQVDMTPECIVLSLSDSTGEGSYRFACPSCSQSVRKPADHRVASLLISAGVVLDREPDDGLEGPPDPQPRGGGAPPFTLDDLIDFHFMLEDEVFADMLFSL